ncbi:glycoside hydrolase family 31 protein [Paenibacillus flagellatus]|uniref:Glycoside hydrolase n=1 Tax=Paenibacillus flagellatus TaxID=2211139 RepID=A0A2V5K3V1_9BACL|nr:glycoside hydrolase family 31 protein [Paenibacillus flagellatus]PYI53949.1 glycoside hydrolase [Paenibacillus flagellatus]
MSSKRLEIPVSAGEYWWGGSVAEGQHMPYGGKPIQVDLSVDLNANQGCPLLLSNRGSYVWSEEPFAFRVENGTLIVESRGGDLIRSDGHGSLRGAYLHASRTYFPPAGELPERLLFTAPQYNLWIELMYEPTQDKVLRYARDVLAAGMAPGVIMIDDNWHEPYGTWEFHSGRFPDPKAMTDELHALGFRVMLWVCPFVSPDSMTFRELEPQGVLLKDKDGQTALRRWWNGVSAVLDCTNEAAVRWIWDRLDRLQREYGIDGFKFDAGDLPFYEPDDRTAVPAGRNAQCEAWAKVGLRYRLNEYRACWKLAGQPLVQRLKDKNHRWDGNGLASLIPEGIAQGLLGYSFVCPDMIGGGSYLDFTDEARLDPELFVRYAQCSALFPMMQFSAAPWRVLSGEYAACCIEAARLHAELGEEIAALAEQCAASGEPMLRHMAYEFPEAGLEEAADQFMLGGDILVAPVVTKGARSRTVAFPAGTWLGDDGSVVQGPARLEVEAPLSRLPWYRKQA